MKTLHLVLKSKWYDMIASGEKRRYMADLRSAMIEQLAGVQLAEETRAEYRAAVLRVVRAERKKKKRRIVRN